MEIHYEWLVWYAGMPINVLVVMEMQSRHMNSKHQCTRQSSCGELRGLDNDNDNDMQWERRQCYTEIRSVRFNTMMSFGYDLILGLV